MQDYVRDIPGTTPEKKHNKATILIKNVQWPIWFPSRDKKFIL